MLPRRADIRYEPSLPLATVALDPSASFTSTRADAIGGWPIAFAYIWPLITATLAAGSERAWTTLGSVSDPPHPASATIHTQTPIRANHLLKTINDRLRFTERVDARGQVRVLLRRQNRRFRLDGRAGAGRQSNASAIHQTAYIIFL